MSKIRLIGIVSIAILIECGFAVGVGLALYVAATPGRARLYERAREMDHTIDFFGVVQDEEGTPVSGALVTFSILSANPRFRFGLPGDSPFRESKGTTTTAPDGTFVIHGAFGSTLTIDGVSREGYRWITSAEQDQDTQRYYFSRKIASLYQPDRAKPAVFPLRHIGSTVPVTASRGGSDIIIDGRLQVNQPFVVHEEKRK